MKKVRVTRISTGDSIILSLSCDDVSNMLFRCDGLLVEVIG